MWKKIAIAGAVGAAVLGGGTAALAASGTPSPSPSTSPSAPASGPAASPAAPAKKHAARKGGGALLRSRNVLHAEWATVDAKTKTTVTHDAIRGTVTAVSPTSIAVKASDGVTETYSVAATTKVHLAGQAKGVTGSITSIKTGDSVLVVGTGAGSLTATRVSSTR